MGQVMNNLPLQPLVWKDSDICSHIKESARSPLHGYFVSQTSDNDEVSAGYYENGGKTTRYATGFATIDEAKAWAWNHYNEKMRPYVKPMPTWIDASERLPEKHTYVLVMYHAHFDDEEIKEFDFCVARFGVSKFDVRDQHFYTRRKTKVTHWMPIPKLPSEADND